MELPVQEPKRSLKQRHNNMARKKIKKIASAFKKRVTSNFRWAGKTFIKKVKYHLGGGAYGAKMNKRYSKMKKAAQKKGTWK